MDREKFIYNLEKESTDINEKRLIDLVQRSIDSNLSDGNPRGHRNLIIVMEELAELSQALAKELRGKGDCINLLEELADVQLGVYYIQEICKVSNEDLHKAMNAKLERLEDVLLNKGKYK